jgi:N-acetyl-beta-hexosaminidase
MLAGLQQNKNSSHSIAKLIDFSIEHRPPTLSAAIETAPTKGEIVMQKTTCKRKYKSVKKAGRQQASIQKQSRTEVSQPPRPTPYLRGLV